MPEPGAVARAVVGEDPLAADAVLGEPGSCPPPERRRGGGLLVPVDLAVDEASAVVDGGVDVAIARTAVAAMAIVAPAVEAPAAAVGDGADLLHVDVDELARPFPLVALHRPAAGPVPPVEAAEACSPEDYPHGGGGQVDLEGDAIGAPPAGPAQFDHPTSQVLGRAPR
jgi:hypothetical protein